MLNQKKKINSTKNLVKSKELFWKTSFPSNSRFQLSPVPNSNFLSGLPVVFGQQPLPQKFWWKKKKVLDSGLKLHFFFSSIVFNSIFLFKKFSKIKKSEFGKFKLKKKLLLLNKIFSKKDRYKGYLIKQKKGGFLTTTLGFRSFMPKSHSDRLLVNKAPIQWLLGVKIDLRRKRFSACDKKTNINIVSSSKQQQKSIRLKKGQRVKGRGHYWSNVASIINKRAKKQEAEDRL